MVGRGQQGKAQDFLFTKFDLKSGECIARYLICGIAIDRFSSAVSFVALTARGCAVYRPHAAFQLQHQATDATSSGRISDR
jgi:hypothetical protein